MKLISLLLFCFLFFCFPSFSQGLKNDTSPIDNQVKQSVQLYDQFTGGQASIYNGAAYIPYNFGKEGTAFFDSDTLTNGWVSYEGRIYQPIPVQYDVSRNQVVILNGDQWSSRIILHNNAVDSFHFLNHTFILLRRNPQQNLNNTGFYEVIYNGKIKVLAARKKDIREVIKGNEIVRIFDNKDHFYIYKVDKYYLVTNKKDVFELFNDKRHEIKTLMRRQRIKFRNRNFEQALLTAVAIYDQH